MTGVLCGCFELLKLSFQNHFDTPTANPQAVFTDFPFLTGLIFVVSEVHKEEPLINLQVKQTEFP